MTDMDHTKYTIRVLCKLSCMCIYMTLCNHVIGGRRFLVGVAFGLVLLQLGMVLLCVTEKQQRQSRPERTQHGAHAFHYNCTMGNTESAMVQKRLERFRPEERPVVEGVFDRLLVGAGAPSGPPGTTLTLEMLQASMGGLAPDSMVRRVHRCMVGIDPGPAAPEKSGASEASRVGREQLVIFLADSLRGIVVERAPLVMAMARGGGEVAVTSEQLAEDLISAVVHILVHRGRLQAWQPERMGDSCLAVKLLAQQMCSELQPSDEGSYDVSYVEDWISWVSPVWLYLEMLVAEGLDVALIAAPPLLPPCREETPWRDVRSLLDIPTLMFLTAQGKTPTAVHRMRFCRDYTGLWAVSPAAVRRYHVVDELKTMTEAQHHCRENHMDLATIRDQEDLETLKTLKRPIHSRAWIGLFYDMDNLFWSLSNTSFYKPGEMEFRRWKTGEPNNNNNDEHCVMMNKDGRWIDFPCGWFLKSICFDVRGPNTLVLITTTMTWTEAQNYCREHHTDLASVRNMEENQMVHNLVPDRSAVWIGLFRVPWKWSDGNVVPVSKRVVKVRLEKSSSSLVWI
ncbi:uncharacterized protein LOC130194756 isoform X2 [Pseudoliparis swirei]|uniref:uncharacterized protein LOC130194756 isoform X2 n=1 Tax=Pseudoliparis swirei TaxID=2059687 RepID=UPI0024BEE42F|nr:uncharacterized protein LOC130194756 isoform X2 [Pseudoliparis swirei]